MENKATMVFSSPIHGEPDPGSVAQILQGQVYEYQIFHVYNTVFYTEFGDYFFQKFWIIFNIHWSIFRSSFISSGKITVNTVLGSWMLDIFLYPAPKKWRGIMLYPPNHLSVHQSMRQRFVSGL